MSRISLRLILDSFSGLMKRHMSLAFFLTMLVGLGGEADNVRTTFENLFDKTELTNMFQVCLQACSDTPGRQEELRRT